MGEVALSIVFILTSVKAKISEAARPSLEKSLKILEEEPKGLDSFLASYNN